ncbi:protein DpdD [Solimonas sp. SE-A11]|uniref:protein DpdD n=1 Tax=Solimonas sp. SE-A11 TaxID=3054954 RepID=UPI00259D175E|nr:protein DpdD [Solimonas sp. SE-A11]MDM4769076.1 protein DpdD [Solimonas sp. SE-A11]
MAENTDREVRSARAVAFQADFFSSPNLIRPEAYGGALNDALRWQLKGNVDRPMLLPLQLAAGEPVIWYACAHGPVMLRALQHEVTAFLGPSFVKMAPSDRAPDAADVHMIPLAEKAELQTIRFVSTGSDDKPVLARWHTYWQLIGRRPATAIHLPQTLGQARAAFDRALAARSQSASVAALAALRERFGLSAENRLYLEIRHAAAFGRWEEIARHRLLHSITNLPLPTETYGDVMEAVYESEVRSYEQAPQVDDLLIRFRERMLDVLKPLFRTRRTSTRGSVLKAFVLHELAQDRPQAKVCKRLLKDLPNGAFGGLDAVVRDRISSLDVADAAWLAQQALELEQFDRAYELLWSQPDDASVLQGLIICAREAENSDKACAVLERLDGAPSEIRTVVERAAPTRLQRLRLLAAKHVRATASLADRIRRGQDESAEDYIERWREWSRSSLEEADLSNSADMITVAGYLTHLVVEEPDLFESVCPLWHELFVDRFDPDRRLIPVYVALLEGLRVRGSFAEADLELVKQTLTALILAGPDAKTYARAVDEVHEIFKEERSPYVMGWILDVCDGLAIAPARDPDSRLRLLTSVVQAGIEYRKRMTSIQHGLLKLLAGEANLSLPEAPKEGLSTETSLSADPLSGGILALYSLDEMATQRAALLLREQHPELRIEVNADHVCTPRLRSLAQRASVFVFAWKSSKHAAYDCVKASIKCKEALVMVPGAGTTSLIVAATQRMQQVD